MTAAAISTVAACLGIGGLGYLLGRMHARAIAKEARPGYIVEPARRVEEWTFPPAPDFYDQDARDRDGSVLLASIGHPLVSDPSVLAMNAGMDAARKAMES